MATLTSSNLTSISTPLSKPIFPKTPFTTLLSLSSPKPSLSLSSIIPTKPITHFTTFTRCSTTPLHSRPDYIPHKIPDPNYVRIFNTTLRDGEQSPGASMTPKQKLEIARQLARLGVDIIEAGFPAASNADLEAVKTIAIEVGNAVDEEGYVPVICGLSKWLPVTTTIFIPTPFQKKKRGCIKSENYDQIHAQNSMATPLIVKSRRTKNVDNMGIPPLNFDIEEEMRNKILSAEESIHELIEGSRSKSNLSKWLGILKEGETYIKPSNRVSQDIRTTVEDVEDELNYWKLGIIACVVGLKPHVNVFEGFCKRIWGNANVEKVIPIKKKYLIKWLE